MGLGDMSSTILVRYKGDTKQLRGEMKKLRGEEKKRHKEMLEEMEKQNAKIDDQIAMWGKVAAGVGLAVGAYKTLSAGFEEYVQKSKLQAATAGADIGKLQKAVGGLASEMEVLRFAQNAMTGDFKLTQAQMEQVLRGSQALAAQGHDLTQVLERVGQAIREGNVEPLKEFGIVMRTDLNDTMAGSLAIVDEMGEKWEELGGKADFAGKSTEQAKVRLADAFSDLKVGLGELVEALTPVIELIAEAVGGLAILVKKLNDLGGGFTGGIDAERLVNEARRKAGLPPIGGDPGGRNLVASGRIASYNAANINSEFIDVSPEMVARDRRLNQYASEKSRKAGSAGFDIGGNEVDPATQEAVNRIMAMEAQRRRDSTAQSTRLDPVFEKQLEMASFEARAVSDQIARDLEWGAVGARVDERNSILTQIFGTPEEIDMQAQAIGVLSSAFNALTGAAGAAMDAWITGSQSATEAAKEFIAESLRGIAVQMTVEAAKHAAMALGALAIGGPLGGMSAAQHGAAAAAFAGVAAIAGGSAKGMGAGGGATMRGRGGGGRSPATAGLGGAGASLSAGEAAGGRTTVVMMDEAFDSLPAAQRRTQMRKRMRQSGYTFDSDVVEMR